MNTEPGFECPECNAKLYGRMRCPACGWKRTEDHEDTPKVSCWTCDRCKSRTPGQPVIDLPDGPGGAARGLCSACHFDERIKPTVRATPEEVRASLDRIAHVVERATMRMVL